MHSAIHLPLADASARARTERHARGERRGPLAAVRARMSRALAVAPGVPSRAAPGIDARQLGHPPAAGRRLAAPSLRGR